MGLGITETEMLEQLAARDCPPLSTEETAQLVELFRRATGGVKLLDKPGRRPVAERPAAWLVEFFMAARAHVATMQRMPPSSDLAPVMAGAPKPPPRYYDPLGEDECGNPIRQGHE
jgi:hypothetical protein